MRIVLPILAVIALAGAAFADPAAEEAAKEHYAHAKQLVAQRQFAEAYTEFSVGYDLSDRPQFLFNMGECKRLLGDAASARELYQRYLQEAPQGDVADLARARLAELGPPPPAVASHPPTPAPPPPPTATPAKPVDLQIHTEPVPPAMPPLVDSSGHPQSPPVWHRTSFWVGVGAAVVVGSAVIYAATRGGPSCTSPTCVDLR
jgi:tetratricopeptide (TPR) repeat protein